MTLDNIKIRLVQEKDKDLLLKWKNEPIVRKSAFNIHKISKEEHYEWFKKILVDPDVLIFIIELRGEPIGEVRFNKQGEIAETDISIAKEYRKKGYGSIGLKESCERAFKDLEINKIIAKIKTENLSSIKTFEKAGFKESLKNDHLIMELKGVKKNEK